MRQRISHLRRMYHPPFTQKHRPMSPRIHTPFARPRIDIPVINPPRHPLPEHSRSPFLSLHRLLCRFLRHHLVNLSSRSPRIDPHPGGFLPPASIEVFEPDPIKRRVLALEMTCHAPTVAQRSKPGQILSRFIVFPLGKTNRITTKLCRGFESLSFRHLISNALRIRVANRVAKEAVSAS